MMERKARHNQNLKDNSQNSISQSIDNSFVKHTIFNQARKEESQHSVESFNDDPLLAINRAIELGEGSVHFDREKQPQNSSNLGV